jgi:hypothetical protein
MAIFQGEWLRLIETEYLDGFIAEGGASVKLVIAPEIEAVNATLARVAGIALERNYLIAWVDAARVQVQMVDQLFHAVARQVDWNEAMERWLRERFAENGYTLPEGVALSAVDTIASENNTSRPQLLAEIRRWIRNTLTADGSLCKEFRTALAMLAWGLVNPQNVSPSDAEIVRQWLRGEKPPLGPLKRMQIHQRIGRHNARLMLTSLTAFLPKLGYKGTLLAVDLCAVVSDSPLLDAPLKYSRAAVQDVYEALRQFIDSTDEMKHFLLVAAAGPGLIFNEKRGLDCYSALKLRTVDDVRDRNRANPLGALVRLEEEESV